MPSTHRQKATAIAAAAAAVMGSAGIASAVSSKSNSSAGDNAAAQARGKRGNRPARAITDTQISQIATKLGISSDTLKAALNESRPEGGKGARGTDARAAALATALGVDQADVVKVLEANRPERPSTPPAQGERRARPGQSKLISALTSGLNKDEATVKAALDKLEASHKADKVNRGPGKMLDTLASELKLDSADVQAAFKAVLGDPQAAASSAAKRTK